MAETKFLTFLVVGVIVAAVRDWSDGRYTKVGCNLKFILDWAWARVVEIKVHLNNLTFIFLLLYDAISIESR